MNDFESYMIFSLVANDKNIKLLRELLDWGVDPNLSEPPFSKNDRWSGNTLLHAAAKSTEDNIETFKELINAGADIDRSNDLQFTPLHYAVIYRKRRHVKVLLQSRTLNINEKNIFEFTALHYAINNNHEHIDDLCNLPLHLRVPDLSIIRDVLNHNRINVNEKDMNGKTPLMWAVIDKQVEIVMMLLKKDERLDASDESEKTALHMALTHDGPCPYIVVLLLLNRASLLKMSNRGEIPLNIIIHSKSFEFACICLKIIAFNYDIKGFLMNKLTNNLKLSRYLDSCYNEIKHMKRDRIGDVFTVYDFLLKYAPSCGFENPVLQIYKPIIDRLIVGIYLKYFCYIFHRISKVNLCAVLKAVVDRKYCQKEMCSGKECKKQHPTAFSKIVTISSLTDYLSHSDIFRLIVIFSRKKVDNSIFNICERECYLTDSWEEYPDEYFD